jgi:hypothetical protein
MILTLMQKTLITRVSQILTYSLMAVLVLLPFHAFITTWAGATFGGLDVFRIWKELLMIPMTIGGIWLLYKIPKAKEWLLRSRILTLILAYIVLHLVLGLLAWRAGRVNSEALIYALLINTRFLIFFVVAYTASLYWRPIDLHKILVWPAILVVAFAVAQIVLFSPDFLTHFGYGDATIPAIHTVDQKLEYQRAQSTLRGPNPLGAYLVVILTFIVWHIWKQRPDRRQYVLLALVSFLALYWTYSRSAWLGLSASLLTLVWLSLRSGRLRRQLAMSTVTTLLIVGGFVFVFRQNDFIQNVVFHTDEKSLAADSSNADRADSLTSAVTDVVQEPWGQGPGTAGPASFRNGPQPARISENYFLQIGQEVGLVGIGLFVGINLLVAYALWRRGGELGLVLVACWVGITLINMLSHAWADDTLSYLWWGLAGIALAKPLSISYTGQKAKTRKELRHGQVKA